MQEWIGSICEDRMRKKPPSSERKSNLRSVAINVFTVTLVGLTLATTLYSCGQRLNSSGPYRSSYEGKIVYKSATISESQRGSGMRYRLSIIAPDGLPFEVAVDREIYERASVGMLIKKDSSGVKLDDRIVGAGESLERK